MDFGATSTIAAALQAHVRVLVHAETPRRIVRAWGRQRRRADTGSVDGDAVRAFFAESPREQARTRVGTIHRFPDREGA